MRDVGDQSVLPRLRIAQAERHIVEGSDQSGQFTLPWRLKSLAELPTRNLPGDTRQTLEADSQLSDQRVQHRTGEGEKCQQQWDEPVVPGIANHAVVAECERVLTSITGNTGITGNRGLSNQQRRVACLKPKRCPVRMSIDQDQSPGVPQN